MLAGVVMRFLMLNWRDPRNPRSGGAERVTLSYLAHLAGRGHEVFWFAPQFEGGSEGDWIDGVRILRAGADIWRAIPAARRWYHQQPRFDLVVDQHHGIPWYAPWWCRTHCVAYIHEVLGPIWNAFYRWPYSVLGRWQERWTHRLYRRVPFWTPSRATQRSLMECGVRSVTVIPNGVDVRPLEPLAPKAPDPPLRLITVSRLAPNKRVDHALHALALLQARGIAARLTIVGTGEVESQIRGLARTLDLSGLVRFTGPLPEADKNASLAEAHLLVHTSMREGWGLNVIEANALGTPAVVYPVAGLTESTLDRQTGLVTAGETPAALADAIQQMAADPGLYQSCRQNAWRRAREFHWDHILPRATDWLEEQARGNAQAALPSDEPVQGQPPR